MGIRPPVIVIAGPTASGKSALGLALAEQKHGVIVNADSAQIYRDVPILSAAPTQEDRSRAEHRLYGVVAGATPCSAADWAKLAREEITRAHQASRLPILVGGTGLYLRTLLDGIAPVPTIDPAIRAEIRDASAEVNLARLARLDPDRASRLNPGDRARVARALEVIVSTGRTLTDWQKDREGGIAASVELHPLVLLPPRDWLYERCNARFEHMVETGAIEEVARLLARALNPRLPVMRAIGVKEITAFIHGEISREEMVASGQQATRRYAKRQYTWFAHQPPPEWPRSTEPIDRGSMSATLELIGASS